MKKYKIRFNNQENEKFNIIENKEIKSSCMSIYSYLLKLNNEKNVKYEKAGVSHLKEITKLNISMRDFLKRYNTKYHINISIRTLKKKIDLLKKLGLIVVEKVKNSFTYSFFRYMVNKKVNKQVNNLEVPQEVENTIIEGSSEIPKCLNTKTNYDLDSNSVTTKNSIFDKEKYIENQEKCNWNYVCDIMTDAFIKLKITSKFVKSKIIEKMCKYYNTITRKHAEAYIVKAIKDASKRNEDTYKEKVLSNIHSTFNNFEQRNYNFENLEKTLTGEIEYNPELIYN